MNKLLFDNIGAKIKIVAKVLFYVAIIIGIIALIVGFFQFISADNYITMAEAWDMDPDGWRASYYEESLEALGVFKNGLLLIISAFSMFPIYAFGELLYSCQEIKKNTEAMLQKNNEEK